MLKFEETLNELSYDKVIVLSIVDCQGELH